MSETQTIVNGLVEDGNKCFDNFIKYYDPNDEAAAKRKEDSAQLGNQYYNMATDFYEYGWGEHFHFCPLSAGESFEHSIARYQYRLALRLGLKPGMQVLDIGCGIGGPGRNIAKFSGASIIGLNINRYQLGRCAFHTKKANLERLCKFVEGDFNNMPFADNTFDASFSVEATCHSGDKKVYEEAYRTLKPGGKYAFYEWVMTDKYDSSNKEHVEIKHGILRGDGLPDLQTPKEVLASLRKAGFKILEAEDIAHSDSRPWYYPLQGRWTLSEFKNTGTGMALTNWMIRLLEFIKLAPTGSTKVSSLLIQASKNLVRGGEEGIFSPNYLVVVEKPVQ